jgi:hypothetical protein
MNSFKPVRSRNKTLRVQADVPHMFGTLVIPPAVVLVVWGIFLVERTVANPLSSDFGAILLGSVVLACGLLLIVYLLRAARVSAISQVQERIARAEQRRPRRMVQRTSMPANAAVPQRASERVYVDDVRISL